MMLPLLDILALFCLTGLLIIALLPVWVLYGWIKSLIMGMGFERNAPNGSCWRGQLSESRSYWQV